MPLCWTSDWIFLGINFWELLMLWKLGNCWILEKKFQRSVALDERGGVYVLTHYQGAGCFSPARFVQCANKCTPPLVHEEPWLTRGFRRVPCPCRPHGHLLPSDPLQWGLPHRGQSPLYCSEVLPHGFTRDLRFLGAPDPTLESTAYENISDSISAPYFFLLKEQRGKEAV